MEYSYPEHYLKTKYTTPAVHFRINLEIKLNIRPYLKKINDIDSL